MSKTKTFPDIPRVSVANLPNSVDVSKHRQNPGTDLTVVGYTLHWMEKGAGLTLSITYIGYCDQVNVDGSNDSLPSGSKHFLQGPHGKGVYPIPNSKVEIRIK